MITIPIQHLEKLKHFGVPSDDYDKITELFSAIENMHSAVEAVRSVEEDNKNFVSRHYTDDEIKSIFKNYADETGISEDSRRDSVVYFADRKRIRYKLENEIPLTKEDTDSIIKIMNAFESMSLR